MKAAPISNIYSLDCPAARDEESATARAGGVCARGRARPVEAAEMKLVSYGVAPQEAVIIEIQP